MSWTGYCPNEPIQFAKWAAPIVPVVKGDRTVCICGDYKLTVNQASIHLTHTHFQELRCSSHSQVDNNFPKLICPMHISSWFLLINPKNSQPSTHIEFYNSILTCHLASPLPLKCSKEPWITCCKN